MGLYVAKELKDLLMYIGASMDINIMTLNATRRTWYCRGTLSDIKRTLVVTRGTLNFRSKYSKGICSSLNVSEGTLILFRKTLNVTKGTLNVSSRNFSIVQKLWLSLKLYFNIARKSLNTTYGLLNVTRRTLNVWSENLILAKEF